MKTVNESVDAVYVLSVKTFTDRIAHIRREMSRHGIAFEFVFDHDIPEMDPALEKKTFAADCELRPPHRSLVLKHIEAWRRAAGRGQGRVLIFEDDVVLHPAFAEKFAAVAEAAGKLSPGWLVFLGGADTRVPSGFFLAKGPLFPNPIATADGYFVDAESTRRRLDWLERNKVSAPADHLLKRIDAECGTDQHWSTTALVEQGSVLGIFTSTLDKGRVSHTLLFNRLQYRWKIFRRRTVPGFFIRLRAKLLG